MNGDIPIHKRSVYDLVKDKLPEKADIGNCYSPEDFARHDGYNQALSDITTILKDTEIPDWM